MGLFGYNKKKFDKNTALFKGELLEIAPRAVGNFAICKLLDSICMELDAEYPTKAAPKELEAIDKRIQTLIEKIREAIESKEFAIAREYADMLWSAVIDARADGKERYTPEVLQLLEERACLHGKINELLLRHAAIEKERAKRIEQSVGLDKSSALYAMNHREWKELGAEVDKINGDLTEYKKAYDVRVGMLDMATRKNVESQFDPVVFAHMMEEAAQAYEDDGFDSAVDSFDSTADISKNTQLEEFISDATVSPEEK